MILQPGDIAIDYSSARPIPARIVAAGVKLVVRYISPTRANKKNLTIAERDALHAVGLGICLVWENAATDPLSGAPLGAAHGTMARNFARDLGYPADREIIVAVDFDVQPAQMFKVLQYLGAFKSASGCEQGAYGKDTLVTDAHDAGFSTLGWQTVAWSHGRISPHADVLQHATPVHPTVPPLGSVDDNTVLRSFKAWSTLPDPAPPPPTPPEDDMIVTIFELVDSKAAFVGDTAANGLASHVRWSGPGDQKWADRRAALLGSGARVITASIGNLINFALDGPLPDGDPDHTWSGDEFANTAEIKARNAPAVAVDEQARSGVAYLKAQDDARAQRDDKLRTGLLAAGNS